MTRLFRPNFLSLQVILFFPCPQNVRGFVIFCVKDVQQYTNIKGQHNHRTQPFVEVLLASTL